MRKTVLILVLSCLAVLSVSTVSFAQTLIGAGSTYRGDIKEDGQVDIFDLLEMLKMLSSPEVQPETTMQIADMDESGSLNIFDLLGLLKVLSGAETPGIIYWSPVISSLSKRAIDIGDTLAVYVENFDESASAENVKAYIDNREVELLEFTPERITLIIPEWLELGELRLVAGPDTTNGIYIVRNNGIPGITMVSLPADSFIMGADTLANAERPAHTVSLDAFRISETEITNAQYAAYLNVALALGDITVTEDSVIGAWGEYSGRAYLEFSEGFFISATVPIDTVNRCYINYDLYTGFSVEPGWEEWPVVFVTWYGASAFARLYGMSLPTEAEWEYAARGGRQFEFATVDGSISSSRANYGRNVGYPRKVGTYVPNPFGLREMTGNVSEWCSDWYDLTGIKRIFYSEYYKYGPRHNPQGPESGSERVARGGGWNVCEFACHVSNRTSRHEPSYRISYLGFRVVQR